MDDSKIRNFYFYNLESKGGRMGKITFKIYPSLKLVHFQGVGDISYEMIIDSTRQLHTEPEWQFTPSSRKPSNLPT